MYDSTYVCGIIYLFIHIIYYDILCIQISKIRFEKWYVHQRWTHSQPAKVHKRWRDRRKEGGMSNRFYNFSKWPSCTSQLVSTLHVPWRIYSKYIENARQIESKCSTFYIFLLASWAEPLRYQVWQHLPKSPGCLANRMRMEADLTAWDSAKHVDVCSFQEVKSMPYPCKLAVEWL